MKRSLHLAFIAIVFFAFEACKKKDAVVQPGNSNPTPVVITPPPAFGFYVVGYFPSYRDPNTIPDVKFRMCNVVNYAFASVTSGGGITLASPTVLTTMRTKAKANNAKVFISVNGATSDWKSMSGNVSSRANFINQLMNVVRNYVLDGVDIDWEFPTTTDGSDQMYTALMKQLSDSCHVNGKYYLTAAITAGKYAGGIRDAISSELWSGGYVDFFNIMAYDDFSTTVPYKHHSDLALSTTCLNYWINTRGMPATKAVLGIPAYGRPSGITQTGTVLTYSGILGQGGSSQTDSAIVTAAGFTNYTIYYNGQPTVKKKTMLAKNTAGGVMFWEKGQDTHDVTSLLKAACDTIGRPY
jgi:chitinase